MSEDCIAESNNTVIDLIMFEFDPVMEAIEDDIRRQLGEIGVNMTTRVLDGPAYFEAESSGDFHLLFTRTWGAPYDPHSYLGSWTSSVEYRALENLEPPMTREILLDMIDSVVTTNDPSSIQAGIGNVLRAIHEQAVFLPLWGQRIPYVVNRRLSNFQPSPQAYTYPLSSVVVNSGSTTVTVAPGSGGLFRTVGSLNPHQYSPNQLFVNDWIYEGLVRYGEDGQILPALAASWTIEDFPSGGQRFSFKLREGVLFHDGSAWNCSVAKLNLDHILIEPIRQRHLWLATPVVIENCKIRVFLENSDPVGTRWEFIEETVTCAGLSAPSGTGPFKFVNRTFADSDFGGRVDKTVTFDRHDEYWGAVPGIETLVVQHYETNDEVLNALQSGELDMTLGVGPLTAEQVNGLSDSAAFLDVFYSGVVQNAMLLMNTNKAPTDNIEFRKALFYGLNQSDFVVREFFGLEEPANQLFQKTAPFCNVELLPEFMFDLEKAQSFFCPPETDSPSMTPSTMAPSMAPSVGPTTSMSPTTSVVPTMSPTTMAPTTIAPTTTMPSTTTLPPTTISPTITLPPTTLPPTTMPPTTMQPTPASMAAGTPSTALATTLVVAAVLMMRMAGRH